MSISLKEKKLPKVALIGRTNVGKSTIFNRLTEEKNAITSPIAGTTRDRKLGECVWMGKSFIVIDTAGMDMSTEERIDREAIAKAKSTLAEADLIYFVLDVNHGILPQDNEYAKMLRAAKKPVIVIANKADGPKKLAFTNELYALGFETVIPISAVTGVGTGDLLDATLKALKKKKAKNYESFEDKLINIAIVGKPNVGKSSLLNAIAGENRAIVSDVAGTTRDSQDFTVIIENNKEKKYLNFVDTAGIRRRRKLGSRVESISVKQSFSAIDRASIVLFVIDANENIESAEKHIAEALINGYKSVIFVINKWDLVEDKDIHSDKKFLDFIGRNFPFLTWAPIAFVSAKTGLHITKLINLVLEVNDTQQKNILNKDLDKLLEFLVKKQAPRKTKGVKAPFIYTIRQKAVRPQTFEIVTSQPKNIHFSYLRFITNELRSRFGLYGVGIKLYTERFKPKGKASEGVEE